MLARLTFYAKMNGKVVVLFEVFSGRAGDEFPPAPESFITSGKFGYPIFLRVEWTAGRTDALIASRK